MRDLRVTFSFLDDIARISEAGYLPIQEDIVRVRKGTKGIPGRYHLSRNSLISNVIHFIVM